MKLHVHMWIQQRFLKHKINKHRELNLFKSTKIVTTLYRIKHLKPKMKLCPQAQLT